EIYPLPLHDALPISRLWIASDPPCFAGLRRGRRRDLLSCTRTRRPPRQRRPQTAAGVVLSESAMMLMGKTRTVESPPRCPKCAAAMVLVLQAPPIGNLP